MSSKSILLILLAIDWSIWWCFCKNINNANNSCFLPSDCRFGPIHFLKDYANKQFLFKKSWDGIVCEPRDQSFRIDSTKWLQAYNSNPNYFKCFTHKYEINTMLKLRLPSNVKLLLTIQNIESIFKILSGWKNPYLYFQLANARGFEVKLLNDSENFTTYSNSDTQIVSVINSEISFYADNKKIKSCDDLINLNVSRKYSFFQLVFMYNLFLLDCKFK